MFSRTKKYNLNIVSFRIKEAVALSLISSLRCLPPPVAGTPVVVSTLIPIVVLFWTDRKTRAGRAKQTREWSWCGDVAISGQWGAGPPLNNAVLAAAPWEQLNVFVQAK